MRVFRSFDCLGRDKRTALTIGKFDGVHLGHRRLLERIVALQNQDTSALVVTFDRDPKTFFKKDMSFVPLCSLEQKLSLLENCNIPNCLILRFDDELASMSAEDFVHKVLLEKLNMSSIVIGDGFRFGARGLGDAMLLEKLARELGFYLEVIPKVQLGKTSISSTLIRKFLSLGQVGNASSCLGRNHVCTGTVVHGKKRGRELGFPTANLGKDVSGFIPADGVYIGRIISDRSYPAAVSIGRNPTFGDLEFSQIEAHALYGDISSLDLYGRRIDVEFIAHLRDTMLYKSIDSLKAAIRSDVERCKEYFSTTVG